MIGWTFDTTTVKFDSTTPTWDAGLFAGVVHLHTSGSAFTILPLANVRAEGFAYDRSMFRSPYGSVWHQEGDFRRLVENITVQAWVVDDANGITDAATTAAALAAILPAVVRVECNWGNWDVAAVESFSRQPVESGYRFDIQYITFRGLV